MTSLSPKTLSLLTNHDLIALNQDLLGLQAYVARAYPDGTYLLTKDIETLNGTTRAAALYNPTDSAIEMTLRFEDVDLGGTVAVRDLLAQKELGSFVDSLKATVEPHGTIVLKLSGEHRLPRRHYEAEDAWLGAYQEIYDPVATGTPYLQRREGASGGLTVKGTGNTPANDLQWRDIYVTEEGDHTLELTYYGAHDTPFFIYANDSAGIEIPSTSDSGWHKATIDLPLSKGRNTVRLSSKGSIPEIDLLTFVAP